MAITHEHEIAWKRILHYFDLHLNKRLNKQPPCWLLNALRRRQVTVMASRITGQSNVCSTVRSDCQHRNIKGPRYCPFVMRIHCDRWFPTQKESNMENASFWWRHNGLKDSRSRRDVTRLSNKRSPYLFGVATANRTKVTTPNKYGAKIIARMSDWENTMTAHVSYYAIYPLHYSH